MEFHACGTKEEHEGRYEEIHEPKIEEDEKEDKEHEDKKISEPEEDDDLKTIIVDEGYNVLVRGQTSAAVTCLVEDVKVVHKVEYVKEVNFYDLWDVEFEMNLMDDNDGLHEDLISDVWYAKDFCMVL